MNDQTDRGDAKTRLLDAAVRLIRIQGYAGTTVDALCREAGVTKGAFFHHFKTKDDLGVAVANHWSDMTGAMFAQASYHDIADPLARVLAYVDLRIALIEGDVCEFTCLAGTMAQETYAVHDNIRAACDASISGHARTLEGDIEAAMTRYGVRGDWTARSLALHTQAVLQGAFILAKCKGGPDIARDMALHLKRYIGLLFSEPEEKTA